MSSLNSLYIKVETLEALLKGAKKKITFKTNNYFLLWVKLKNNSYIYCQIRQD